jgi:hypothetical protein
MDDDGSDEEGEDAWLEEYDERVERYAAAVCTLSYLVTDRRSLDSKDHWRLYWRLNSFITQTASNSIYNLTFSRERSYQHLHLRNPISKNLKNQ